MRIGPSHVRAPAACMPMRSESSCFLALTGSQMLTIAPTLCLDPTPLVWLKPRASTPLLVPTGHAATCGLVGIGAPQSRRTVGIGTLPPIGHAATCRLVGIGAPQSPRTVGIGALLPIGLAAIRQLMGNGILQPPRTVGIGAPPPLDHLAVCRLTGIGTPQSSQAMGIGAPLPVIILKNEYPLQTLLLDTGAPKARAAGQSQLFTAHLWILRYCHRLEEE